MYTTHGDMIIIRPGRQERLGSSSRLQRRDRAHVWARAKLWDRVHPRSRSEAWDLPERGDRRERRDEPERGRRGPAWDGPDPSEGLRERIAALEERVSRLEAQLERARHRDRPPARSERPDWWERGHEPHDLSPERSGRHRRPPDDAHSAPDRQVRVSLHAEGGAQVSLGEVRMIHKN